MGQYWIPVNLDKKEFIHPHKLATGLKLWEQVANFPGTPCAVFILTAAYYQKRGGGDLDLDENWHGRERDYKTHGTTAAPFNKEDYPKIAKSIIGRWAGDRIAIVGDYAEDTDLAPEHKASTIYDRCHPETEEVESDREVEGVFGYWNQKGKFLYRKEIAPAEFTDISYEVCMVIEHELQGEFLGEGWRDFVYDHNREEYERRKEEQRARN
jgi:hypothetical protein